MRLYKIVDVAGGIHGFVGSKAAGPTKRREVTEKKGIPARQLSDEEIEVPTGKDGLLEFLNTLVA